MNNVKVILTIFTALVLIGILFVVVVILKDLYYINKAATIARKKCDEYVKQACHQSIVEKASSNDVPSPIMGGWEVPDGMLPHMAFVGSYNEVKKHGCSGTLISEYFVMTAAHCVQDVTVDQLYVKLGSSNLENGTSFKIDKIFAQPFGYDDFHKWPNDIALLKLDKKVEFDWKTRPICLNTHLKSISTTNMTTSGWGTDETGKQSGILQVVDTYMDVPVLTKCLQRFGEHYVSQMVCTGYRIERKGVCPGDSGGPLQIPLKNGCANIYEQIGILSAGDGECSVENEEPQIDLYIKVEYKLPWIVGIVWPELQ